MLKLKPNLPQGFEEFISLLTNQIAQNDDIEKIYLFGSCATGKARESSDVDLAVIVNDRIEANRNFRLALIDKVEDTITNNDVRNISYDIVFFNKSDYERNKNITFSVVKEIEKEGELLYER